MASRYAKLLLAGSFMLEDGRRVINSELVNEIAILWSNEVAGIDPGKSTNSGASVYPL
jgi:hypothetical protein